jgi:glycosyltransferase involved in cell wall biosynthesis
MRVLQLVQKPQRRGAEVFAFELSGWLRSQRHQVRTLYLYPYEGERPLPLLPGDTIAMGNERSSFERLSGVHPRLLRRVQREVTAFRPDVVQVNGARTVKYGATLARLAAKRPWVLVYRNIDSPAFWVKGWLRENYYRYAVMPQVDGVVGVSETTLEEVRQFYRCEAPSVFIPNGVDLDSLKITNSRDTVRRTLDTPAGAKVLIFIGNLGIQKRPERFIRVVADICRTHTDVFAWLLGDGPCREESQRLASALGISERVRFLGYQTEVASFVAAADVHVSTSDSEGIPAAVIEAGHMKLPTVGFRVGGMHECVRDGETGSLVPAGDEQQMINAIGLLLDSSHLRGTMGHAARAWVGSRFSIDAVGRQYEAFYGRLIDERSRQGDIVPAERRQVRVS